MQRKTVKHIQTCGRPGDCILLHCRNNCALKQLLSYSSIGVERLRILCMCVCVWGGGGGGGGGGKVENIGAKGGGRSPRQARDVVPTSMPT